MSKDSFYIRIFNKHDQIHVQDMVISGLLSTAVNRNKSVKDGISAYLKRSLREDLGNIYDTYGNITSFGSEGAGGPPEEKKSPKFWGFEKFGKGK